MDLQKEHFAPFIDFLSFGILIFFVLSTTEILGIMSEDDFYIFRGYSWIVLPVCLLYFRGYFLYKYPKSQPLSEKHMIVDENLEETVIIPDISTELKEAEWWKE